MRCLKTHLSSDNRYLGPTTRPHPLMCLSALMWPFPKPLHHREELSRGEGRRGRGLSGGSQVRPWVPPPQGWDFLQDFPRLFRGSVRTEQGKHGRLRVGSAGRIGSQRRPRERELRAHPPPRARIQRRQSHGSKKKPRPASPSQAPFTGDTRRALTAGHPPRLRRNPHAWVGALACTVDRDSGPQVGVLAALKTSQRDPRKPHSHSLHFPTPTRPPCIIN